MPSKLSNSTGTQRQGGSIACMLLLSVGLTWIFWGPLWRGAGLIGGDLYPYYFPQKAFLSDSLKAGVIPLWNPLVGFGYPTLGESQTGVLYPPHLVLYSLFSINTAYNISQVLHYILAFIATWAFARRVGLSSSAAIYTATVFVYGWFPSRICLEWAIIGGAWFSAILWAGTVYLQTGKYWAFVAGSVFLGLDLLAGHYNLAFITLICLSALPFLLRRTEHAEHAEHTGHAGHAGHTGKSNSIAWSDPLLWQLWSLLLLILAGFLLAAVQLLPSWELKNLSQRQELSPVFSPTYGHLPPAAISQLWQPWSWHAGDEATDRYLEQSQWLCVPNATNQVEASLYCGLLTLGLLLLPVFIPRLRQHSPLKHHGSWWMLAILGLILATGWPTMYLSNVPGIGFFRGPGRYSLLTSFAVAVLAGGGLDALFRTCRLRPVSIFLSGGLSVCLLTVDLWAYSRQYHFGAAPYIGRQVFYATIVDTPPINFREKSQLKQYFARQAGEVRLYAPGQNVPTLLGVSALPVYLGLGPEIYETDQVRVDFQTQDPTLIAESLVRLQRFGVTHLLLEAPLETDLWEVTFLGEQYDELLNRAFGRREPFYLYLLQNALGRVSVEGHPEYTVNVSSAPHSVTVEISNPSGISEGTVILRDLKYPGWIPSEFGDRHEGMPQDGLFRNQSFETSEPLQRVSVRWEYRPWSVCIGAILSLFGLVATLLFPRFLRRRTNPSMSPQSYPSSVSDSSSAGNR